MLFSNRLSKEQAVLHFELSKNLTILQLRQSFFVLAEHVLHVEWQLSHLLLPAFSNSESEVQDATHVVEFSKKKPFSQLKHSELRNPEHVLQLGWQGSHWTVGVL